MNNFYGQETKCEFAFCGLGDCFHLWTPEDFPIIFTSEDDFKRGMSIIGLCSRLFPDVKIITFELMSNHLHILASGKESRVRMMFERIKEAVRRFVISAGRTFDSNAFRPGIRRIEDLSDMRNVIVYDNKNGFIVSPHHTPFSYPWGANRYYFNQGAVALARQNARPITLRERRLFSHSRDFDKTGSDLTCFDGYVSPVSFCAIDEGESLFRNASHYFFQLSRSVETNRKIAKEIGESIYYNDDELFAAVSQIARDRYHSSNLSSINSESKLELAKTMYFDYNANPKQIARMLRLPLSALESLGMVSNK